MNLKELLGDKYKADMTAEDIFSAMESIELKTASDFDALNSQLEEYKKKERESMDDVERMRADGEDAAKKLADAQKKIAQYEQERKFISGGFDDKTAARLAKSLSDGNMDDFMKIQSDWIKSQKTNMESKIKTELMGQMSQTQQDTGSREDEEGEDVRIAKELAHSSDSSSKTLDAYYGNKA